jgi:hypothetical protein
VIYYMGATPVTPGPVAEVLFYKDSGSRSQLALGASMAVLLFCLHGLRVLCPKGFVKGELQQHDIVAMDGEC